MTKKCQLCGDETPYDRLYKATSRAYWKTFFVGIKWLVMLCAPTISAKSVLPDGTYCEFTFDGWSKRLKN